MYFIFLAIITLIFAFVYIYVARLKNQLNNINVAQSDITDESILLSNLITKLKKENEQLKKIVIADENIFSFIRCINVPQTPSCKTTMDENGDPNIPRGTATVCRARQIDCNKYKLLFETDPIIKERILLATDRYTQSNKQKNPSDLTYPVQSGWYF